MDGKLLEGRNALVTGASGGIGHAIVSAFRQHGALCHGCDVKPAAGIAACDVTDERSVVAAFEEAGRSAAVTDVIHVAGIISVARVEDIDLAELRRVLDINLVGSFLVAREAARRLTAGGAITLIASQAGYKGGARWSAYCASKAGVMRLAESLAVELGPRRIRVNSVCPGNVDTTMMSDAEARIGTMEGKKASEIRTRYLARIPLGRLATPSEIASACVFLASPLASYVSGVSLAVDGGELSG